MLTFSFHCLHIVLYLATWITGNVKDDEQMKGNEVGRVEESEWERRVDEMGGQRRGKGYRKLGTVIIKVRQRMKNESKTGRRNWNRGSKEGN